MKQFHESWRAHTPLERRLSARLRHVPSGACLELEQLITLARRGRRAPHYHALMMHIVSCPACRRSYLQTRAIVRAQRFSWLHWLRRLSAPKALLWAPATGVALAALVGLVALRQAYSPAPQPSVIAQRSEPTPSYATRTTVNPQLADVRLRQPNIAAMPPSSEEELQSLAQVPSFVREAVNFLASLPAIHSTRGSASSPWLRILEPDIEQNGAIEPNTTVFKWSPVENATGYRVRLTLWSDSPRPVAESQMDAAQTQFALSSALPAGEYELAITVEQGNSQRTLQRRFYVLSSDQMRQLQWARRYAERKPMLSAAVLYQIDRYGEALQCLERAAQKYPSDSRVQKWRAFVQQRLQQRVAEFTEQ
ncbi:MAG: hypothetical protein NZ874_04655 [Fimbriimonadales bacterium]|nr:hypothetical protein [Fimbriimonadales bacterium]